MSGFFDLAKGAWPSLHVEKDAFEAYAEARTLAADEHFYVEDLYLAYACAQGSKVALATFEKHYMKEVRAALVATRHRRMPLDELEQLVRTKLFVGDSPKILKYSGRGPLAGWLRVVAVRTAVSYHRWARRSQVPPATYARVGLEASEVLDVAAQSFPELELLRRAHEPDLRASLQAALASLSACERRLLHQHFLQGKTIDLLAEIYGVHRSTAARRIVQARRLVCARAQAEVAARLGIDGGELDSLLGQLRERLDLSLRGLLDDQECEVDEPWS